MIEKVQYLQMVKQTKIRNFSQWKHVRIKRLKLMLNDKVFLTILGDLKELID